MLAAANVAVDPTGRHLAIASIENAVYRLELATLKLERIAGDGTRASTGGGGPAVRAQVDSPHGVGYESAGNLWIAGGDLRRIGADGRIETVSREQVFKVVPTAGGTVYALSGNPNGGRVWRVEADGRLTPVVGTGSLSPQRDGVAATAVGILPSDVALARDGALLVAQTEPVPAIRRVDLRTGRITTLVR